jgi:replicative DNA helicase
MIDYIQLMDNTEDEKKGRTDEAIMSLRVKGLMNMWKRHNLCVIELSQLGREVVKEKRRPRMSDLKESGAIEANANVVMLLHRPDYYEENPTDDNGRSLKGIMEIIVDKNRGGRRGFVYANFIGKYSKLTDFNKEEWESGSGIV